ncbi:MAG TPA: hypothetical protein VL053_11895 [Arachidicoccus sp.]|nr:hypothetical protein [Arachidicoccus sp.]
MEVHDFLNKTIFDYTDDPKIMEDVVGYPVNEKDYMEDIKSSSPDTPIVHLCDYAELVGNRELHNATDKYLKAHWPDIYFITGN